MEDCREMWCDGKWLPQVQIWPTVTKLGFGLLLGQAHSVVMARPSGCLYKNVFCIVKGLVSWLVGWRVEELASHFVSSVLQIIRLL